MDTVKANLEAANVVQVCADGDKTTRITPGLARRNEKKRARINTTMKKKACKVSAFKSHRSLDDGSIPNRYQRKLGPEQHIVESPV